VKVACAVLALIAATAAGQPVRSWEGTVAIPTYEPEGRETEPPLFANSSLTGFYPFTTYRQQFQPGGPKPKTYVAIFVENEYLKLTYIPEFGGRIYSLYDKLRRREVFYRNDVVKPASYNPRNSWPISGLELTGPHDLHMLTLHGEPYWANKIVRHSDGAVALVLAEFDPVYQMRVSLTATLHPGVAAMEISVHCFNPRDGRMPQMFWLSGAIAATPKLRFIYPMSRTIGHNTGGIAAWPVHNGVDYSWDRNNVNMLGVFGIDFFDDFAGAYEFERDYGLFRCADRRLVQGMKMWTFGYGPAAKRYERGYTDNAGPYVELQSGRHVWDGNYEWVAPHKTEEWSEWWVPVAGTGGVLAVTRHAALMVDGAQVSVAVTSPLRRAALRVESSGTPARDLKVDLDPARPFRTSLGTAQVDRIRLLDASSRVLLDYRRPQLGAPRSEYTPFTRGLEDPPKSPAQMSVEELTLAAEKKLKQLNPAAAIDLLNAALARDAGYSRAHLLLGIDHYTGGRFPEAAGHLQLALARDPYSSETCYYLAMAQLALSEPAKAERLFYNVWPDSAFYGPREFQLGRLSLLAGDSTASREHLQRAIDANADDLAARLLLALVERESGRRAAASAQLDAVEQRDPANPVAQSERYFLSDSTTARAELLRLLDGQTQEALSASEFYRDVARWRDAMALLELPGEARRDPWGTAPEYYYVLAECRARAGDAQRAAAARAQARAAAGRIDRFPYRRSSLPALEAAVKAEPHDALAHHTLACLLYSLGRPAAAIAHWEAAVEASPSEFSTRRALGLAYAERENGFEKAAAQLERAVALAPAHIATFNDLSRLYASAGRFDEQVGLIRKALESKPGDDGLTESLLDALLNGGRYGDAERLIASHTFAPRHRTYALRDSWRLLRAAMAASAFRSNDAANALRLVESAFHPPVSLGLDDFEGQVSPRLEYLRGRALESAGRAAEARSAFERTASPSSSFSGDRDSWNSENIFVVAALRRLGRDAEAAELERRFEQFALSELDDTNTRHRAEARFLLGLVRKNQGRGAEARKLIESALQARPDLLPARIEIRGESFDPLPH
jgi:Tfp pilus assembly protein PilF